MFENGLLELDECVGVECEDTEETAESMEAVRSTLLADGVDDRWCEDMAGGGEYDVGAAAPPLFEVSGTECSWLALASRLLYPTCPVASGCSLGFVEGWMLWV